MSSFLTRRSFLLMLASGLIVTSVVAQGRRRDDKPTPEQLEIQARKAEEGLAKDYIKIATGFYELGNVEKAKAFLHRLDDFQEGLPGVKEKIAELEEELMNSNLDTISIDVSKGWGDAIAEVTKGNAFRIAAAGEYKMTAQLSLDVNGIGGKDGVNDLAAGVPFGALMGIVQGADGKTSRPFAIKSGIEREPKKSGLLFVRVNTPANAKCVGKLQLQISGKVVTRGGKKKKKR